MASRMVSNTVSRLQKPCSKSIEPTDSLEEVERDVTIARPYKICALEIPDLLATCYSFMRLPPEIREQIYSYLLSAKYTWQDNEGTQMEEEKAADSYWGRQSASLIHNRLLEPLRSLHSLYSPRIEGPVDPRYKADVLKSICKQAPSHEEILRNVSASLEQGIEAFESGKYHLALSTFEAAMVEHDVLPIYYDDPMTIIENGIFAGFPLHKAAAQLKSSLRLNLSETYFQLEQYEHAHDCSELALSAIGEYKQDTGCDLGGIRPAEFYVLMAYASEGLGQVQDALPEMVLASEEELGNENFEAEVKRLRRVLRESGRLFYVRSLMTQSGRSAKTRL